MRIRNWSFFVAGSFFAGIMPWRLHFQPETRKLPREKKVIAIVDKLKIADHSKSHKFSRKITHIKHHECKQHLWIRPGKE